MSGENSSPTPISIWQPRIENGALLFVRPKPHPLGDHYAATRVIRATKVAGTRRLCFLGESVAAGYGFAPHLTPAQTLAYQLAHRTEKDVYEVIDLARTNETLAGLRETVQASMQLAPDMLVLFAGNNWNLLETPLHSPYAPSAEAHRAFGEALLDEGVWGPINQAARKRLERAGTTLAAIQAIAAQADIPVVLVVPEVNLLDWETRQPVSWLATTDITRWHRLLRVGERALQRGAWQQAIQCAHQMLALDDGSCPTAYRLLVRARLGQGREQYAYEAARAEVDSVYFPTLGFLAAPQITTFDQKLLRHVGNLWGWKVVDLPLLFKEVPGHPVADRTLFLDYCHLTEEGIRLAMAAVTQTVLGYFQDQDDLAEMQTLFDPELYPVPPLSSEARAMAYFGTALHTAHRLGAEKDRKDEIVDYWCNKALDADPAIISTMNELVDARLTALPALLTGAQQRNLESPFRLQFQHGWDYDYLDASILHSIERILKERKVKGVLQDSVRQLSEAGNHLRHPMISHPFFDLEEPLEQLYPDLLRHPTRHERAYYRAAWSRTSLVLLLSSEHRYEIDIMLRLPTLPGVPERVRQKVQLRLNRRLVDCVWVDNHWQSMKLRLPPQWCHSGLNRFTVVWPPLPPLETSPVGYLGERLQRGEEVDVHPIFGEIYRFALHTST